MCSRADDPSQHEATEGADPLSPAEEAALREHMTAHSTFGAPGYLVLWAEAEHLWATLDRERATTERLLGMVVLQGGTSEVVGIDEDRFGRFVRCRRLARR